MVISVHVNRVALGQPAIGEAVIEIRERSSIAQLRPRAAVAQRGHGGHGDVAVVVQVRVIIISFSVLVVGSRGRKYRGSSPEGVAYAGGRADRGTRPGSICSRC